MFEPNIDFNSELLFMPYGGSPRARIPLVAPKHHKKKQGTP